MNQALLHRLITDKSIDTNKNCISTALYLLGMIDTNQYIDPRVFNINDYFLICSKIPIQDFNYEVPYHVRALLVVNIAENRLLHAMVMHPLKRNYILQRMTNSAKLKPFTIKDALSFFLK